MPLHRHAMTPHVAGTMTARDLLLFPSQSVILNVSTNRVGSLKNDVAECNKTPRPHTHDYLANAGTGPSDNRLASLLVIPALHEGQSDFG